MEPVPEQWIKRVEPGGAQSVKGGDKVKAPATTLSVLHLGSSPQICLLLWALEQAPLTINLTM